MFSSRMVAVAVVIVLICLGLVVYTGATGNGNPVSDGIGMALAPLQGVSRISEMAGKGMAYFEGYDALEEENAALKKSFVKMSRSSGMLRSRLTKTSACVPCLASRSAAGISNLRSRK